MVAGRNIGEMVYIDKEIDTEINREGWIQMGGTSINPALPVAKNERDIPGDTLPYWPNYEDIQPAARASYLDWLESGRSDPQYSVGYVFLYFYGIERRFFLDKPSDEEKLLLAAEVERLLHVYGTNRSIRGYLGKFLDTAQVIMKQMDEAEPDPSAHGKDLSLRLRVAIGRMAQEESPLSADWLLTWYSAHPEYSLRTAATRAFPEFRALFKLLFDDRHPNGLRIRIPKRTIRARYPAASAAFETDLNSFIGDIPDISSLSQPLNAAGEIVEEATNALDKYSRFLGRNSNGKNTLEAHALLPARLWPLFPSAEIDRLRQWADDSIIKGGLLPVEQVIERLEAELPEKISKRQLTDAADALGRLSIGMAPDPRFALRGPKYGEPVVLFRLPEGITALENVSSQYKSTLIAIAIGSFIASADGTVAEAESSKLESMINNAPKLSATERARLQANLQWMMNVPPDLSMFRRHLKDFPEEASHELGQIALVMSTADGEVGPKEIKGLERLFKTIGLNTDGIYSALHALTIPKETQTDWTDEGPVTVQTQDEPERVFTIPPQPEPDGNVTLNPDRVASVVANTARVASILGEIFQDDDPEEGTGDGPEETREPALEGFPELDKKHGAFLEELLTRPYWREPEYEALARQFGLMPAGAIETVNEWSFERFGDALVEEEGDGYALNQHVVSELSPVTE